MRKMANDRLVNFGDVILNEVKNLFVFCRFFVTLRMTMFFLIIGVMMFSCKAKGPYNPYIRMKKDEKPSTINNKEIKKLEDNSRKSGKKQMRRNRKKVYSS